MLLRPELLWLQGLAGDGAVAVMRAVSALLCQTWALLLSELGFLVSILTVVELCGVSTLLALSVAQYSIVCRPSLEWSAGAETVTSVLSAATVWTAPPSTEYLMFLTPELFALKALAAGGSVAVRWTV